MKHQTPNSRGNYNYNAYFYDGISWDRHFHGNFELIYCVLGENAVSVGDRSFTLSPGELLLIPPWQLHAFTVDPGKKLWVGVFSEDYIPAYAKRNGGKLYAPFRSDIATEEYLKAMLFHEDIPALYTAKSALYAVCAACESKAELCNDGENDRVAGSILSYLSKHYTEELSMREVASVLGYEYHYFSKLFHDCFSVNFKQLLNICRFERACELLEKTDRDLTDIAMESGFQSIRSFNRIFKEMSGLTPREYRSGAGLSQKTKPNDNDTTR